MWQMRLFLTKWENRAQNGDNMCCVVVCEKQYLFIEEILHPRQNLTSFESSFLEFALTENCQEPMRKLYLEINHFRKRAN